jgi:hypothetical protein
MAHITGYLWDTLYMNENALITYSGFLPIDKKMGKYIIGCNKL